MGNCVPHRGSGKPRRGSGSGSGGSAKINDGGVRGSGGGDEPMTLAEIESRIESIDKTTSATFGGLKVRYAYLSQRGYYPDGESDE